VSDPAARPPSLLGAALGRLNRLAGLLVFLAAAAAGSQTGPFIDAYAHNLDGRAAEAARQVDAIRDRAAAVDLSLDAYVRTFREARNPVFRREGAALADQVARAEALDAARAALDAAGPLRRPVVFVRRMDPEIARATARRYAPAVPLDPAGAGYAVVAGATGWAAWQTVVGLGLLGATALRRPAAALISGPRRRAGSTRRRGRPER